MLTLFQQSYQKKLTLISWMTQKSAPDVISTCYFEHSKHLMQSKEVEETSAALCFPFQQSHNTIFTNYLTK